VNFSPDVQPAAGSKPEWLIDIGSQIRACNLSCHGGSMYGNVSGGWGWGNSPYRPPSGDDIPTY
jgi:hypothetical protein